jgi:hypothetical protein
VSNKRRLPRAAKRQAAQALAKVSECPDCGARAARPRREREGLRQIWTLDIPHDQSCPSRVMPHLRDSMAVAAIEAAQPQVRFPLEYVARSGVVIAGER